MRYFFLIIITFVSCGANAQNKNATVSGKIIDANDAPIPHVSIVVLGKNTGIMSSDSGAYSLKAPAFKPFALVYSHSGYRTVQKNFYLSAGETEYAIIKLTSEEKTLSTVVISDEKEKKEPGNIKIDPHNALLLPSTTGGVEGLIKVLVGSNNELTSQYNVRGGNYDENSIYINDLRFTAPIL